MRVINHLRNLSAVQLSLWESDFDLVFISKVVPRILANDLHRKVIQVLKYSYVSASTQSERFKSEKNKMDLPVPRNTSIKVPKIGTDSAWRSDFPNKRHTYTVNMMVFIWADYFLPNRIDSLTSRFVSRIKWCCPLLVVCAISETRSPIAF